LRQARSGYQHPFRKAALSAKHTLDRGLHHGHVASWLERERRGGHAPAWVFVRATMHQSTTRSGCVVRQCTGVLAEERAWEQLDQECGTVDLGRARVCYHAWSTAVGSIWPAPLLAAYRDNRLVALLPVMREERRIQGVRLAVLETAGNDHWKAGGPISGRDAEGSIQALLQGLRQRRDWDMLELKRVLEPSETLDLLVREGRRLGGLSPRR
jgi:hypothetical protein